MPMENANVQFFSTVPVRRTKYELVVSVQIQYGMFFAKNNLKEVKKIAKSLLISGSSLAGIDTHVVLYYESYSSYGTGI